MLKIYDPSRDEEVAATQDDIDRLQQACFKLAKRNEIIKLISNLNIINDEAILKQISTILKV